MNPLDDQRPEPEKKGKDKKHGEEMKECWNKMSRLVA
jgi:hypothetical protein